MPLKYLGFWRGGVAAFSGDNMDYYQGVVVDYLRADRAVFVNTECCIQLDEGAVPAKDQHWFCDAVAIDLRGAPKDGTPTVFLCEISYAVALGKLVRRLKCWKDNWAGVRKALQRDCKIPSHWPVRPWLFVPEALISRLVGKLEPMTCLDGTEGFKPRITALESVQPWRFHSWDHQDSETDKLQSGIPEAMRI
jgi:hypothetical protein